VPTTIVRSLPISIAIARRHSRLIGESAMRGAFTWIDGSTGRFAYSASLSPCGRPAAHRLICPANASLTRLTTNSPVSWMLRTVSFGIPGSRQSIPRTTVGGDAAIMLNRLNGAAFSRPLRSIEVTSAIGRGTTLLINSLYRS